MYVQEFGLWTVHTKKKVFAIMETHAENHNTSYLWASRYQTNLWTRNGLLTANNSAHPGPSPPPTPTRSPAPFTPPTPPSTKFDHFTNKKRRVHGLAEKASPEHGDPFYERFSAFVPPYTVCGNRLSVSTNSTVISIRKDLFCLSPIFLCAPTLSFFASPLFLFSPLSFFAPPLSFFAFYLYFCYISSLFFAYGTSLFFCFPLSFFSSFTLFFSFISLFFAPLSLPHLSFLRPFPFSALPSLSLLSPLYFMPPLSFSATPLFLCYPLSFFATPLFLCSPLSSFATLLFLCYSSLSLLSPVFLSFLHSPFSLSPLSLFARPLSFFDFPVYFCSTRSLSPTLHLSLLSLLLSLHNFLSLLLLFLSLPPLSPLLSPLLHPPSLFFPPSLILFLSSPPIAFFAPPPLSLTDTPSLSPI